MYSKIGFWRFVLALAVITIPAALLENTNEKWAWRYVLLILLMLIVTQFKGVEAFAAFIRSELAKGL